MDINNVTQFVNFIVSNQFGALDTTFVQLVNCINNFSAACNCHKVEDKRKFYNQCNKLYIDAVRIVVPKHKNVILARVPEGRITFRSDNGSLIAIVSR